MILIHGESLLAIKLNLIMMSFFHVKRKTAINKTKSSSP